MNAEKARKAVVTLAQVQEAFSLYQAVKADMGTPILGHAFDRGNRGKGFAEYDHNDSVVRSFDTKEEAHTFYARYAEIAREVMAAVGHAAPVSDSQEVKEGQEEEEQTATVPAQTRRRVKAQEKVS